MDKITYEYLYNAYVVEGKSQLEIALDLDTTQMTISKYMKKWNIPARQIRGGQKPHVDREAVYRLIDEGKKVNQIAKELGISTSTVHYIAQGRSK